MASPYDESMAIVCSIVQSQMAWPSLRTLATELQRALAALGDKSLGAEMRDGRCHPFEHLPGCDCFDNPQERNPIQPILPDPKVCRQCGRAYTVLYKVVRLATGQRQARPMKGSAKRGLCYYCAGQTAHALNQERARSTGSLVVKESR